MRGIAGEKKPAAAHRLRHKTPHRRYALLEDRPCVGFPINSTHSQQHFVPNGFVRPIVDIFIWRNLKIQACDFWRAHAEKCKAALMAGVDQFLRRWSSLG